VLALPSHLARKAEALHLADRTSEALEGTNEVEALAQGLNEPRELYFALQMLQHKADAVLERAMILRSLYGAGERSRLNHGR
jgi:hypothetical protein